MINVHAKPALLPPQIQVPLENLVFMSAAIPFRVDGVAVVGDRGERAPKLPTIIRLDDSRKDVPAVEYQGSALLKDLLDSSPQTLAASSIPLFNTFDDRNFILINTARSSASVRDLIAANKGAKCLLSLAFTYGEAARFLDRYEAGGEGFSAASPQFEEVVDLLRRLSPMAWEAAQGALSDDSQTGYLPHMSYAKHCLIFLAGAFTSAYRNVDMLRYAILSMSKVSEYFEIENDSFENGEGLAVKASIHEIIAEVLDFHALEEKDVGWGVYPEHFVYGAAKAWRDYLKVNEAGQNREGIYLRALNAAQAGQRYDVMGDLFEVASGFEKDEVGSARFLVRAVWAMLNNFTGDRSDAEKLQAVSILAGRAETLFLSSGMHEAELVATQARILSSESYDLAEELAQKN